MERNEWKIGLIDKIVVRGQIFNNQICFFKESNINTECYLVFSPDLNKEIFFVYKNKIKNLNETKSIIKERN